jgi:hypothetical protein
MMFLMVPTTIEYMFANRAKTFGQLIADNTISLRLLLHYFL